MPLPGSRNTGGFRAQNPPFLWFDDKAEEAANFYISIFKNSRITSVARYGEAGPGAKGSVMTIAFHLDGQDFVGLNGGPPTRFLPPYHSGLIARRRRSRSLLGQSFRGGQALQCGWLTDKFGVTWQVVPSILPKLLQDEDPQKSQRVMKAMFQWLNLTSQP